MQQEYVKHLKAVGILVLLHLAIDIFYTFVYPTVNPIRATLIGATALVVLWSIPWFSKQLELKPYIAFLPIFVSALGGALLINANVMQSKSLISGTVHVLILVVAYVIIVGVKRK